MTDAERIAVYLKTTVIGIERCLSEPANRASSIHVRELAAMLSDVRREERAAIRAIVRERTALAGHNGLEHAVIQLNLTCAAIDARGIE